MTENLRLNDPRLPLVIRTIVTFSWWNYGLDEVGEADPEYASDLAAEILDALDQRDAWPTPNFTDPAHWE